MDRIEFIASLAKDSDILLDVGCDHAYTVIKAVKDYNVKHAIASDVADKPLMMAKRNISEAGLNDVIKVIKSDGLKDIDEDFTTLIISGMGGVLIKDILSSSVDKIKNKKLILSPNRDFSVVRKFLNDNNFKISDEFSFYDKKVFYEVIVAEIGNEALTKFEIDYGPILLKKKEKSFIDFYTKLHNDLNVALQKVSNVEEKNRIQILINEYQKIIK